LGVATVKLDVKRAVALFAGKTLRNDQKSGWFKQQAIRHRVARLKALIRDGTFDRREIETMTYGHPITRIPFGQATTLYAWTDRSSDLSGG
jgi:hypothetical protein